MNNEQTNSQEQATEDVEGFFAIAPRNPYTGRPLLETLILGAVLQGKPVLPFGPIGGGQPVVGK